MENLTTRLENQKKRYRYIFLEIAEHIDKKIQSTKPDDVSGDIFDHYKNGATGRIWQAKVLKVLIDELKQSKYEKLSKISELRKSFSCNGCGVCCRFAVSEFSPDELKQKAKCGDNYAKQFIETFVPYESLEQVYQIFPEYVELLRANNEFGYYFYHCPKVTDDNRCPDYENRPQICRDFPDNPVGFLPLACGFCGWKLQSEDICLKLNAEVEIINFYISKIKETQK